jgi:UDP-glucose 4-epimerase
LKLLVTGGLGYIGGRFAEHVAATTAHELRLTTRGAPAGQPGIGSAVILRADPFDAAAFASLCQGVEVVINLGGPNAAQCALDPQAAIDWRVAQMRALLSAAGERGVRRVIHVSTAHVYGKALMGEVDEAKPVEPTHPYALSHLAAEQVLRDAHSSRQVEAVVARLSNSFGAPMNPDCDCWTLVTNDLARQAVGTRQMKLHTPGLQRRDFIAMSEVCRALLQLCETGTALPSDSLVNVGAGDAPTLLEQAGRIAAVVEAELGFCPQIVCGTREDPVGGGELEFRSLRLRSLGFEPCADAVPRELARLAQFCAKLGVAA